MKPLRFHLTLCLLFVAATATATRVTLASDGTAKLPIVIAPDASPRIQAVADELAGYLGQMSGGEFEIVTGSGKSRGIILGTLEQFPQRRFTKKSRIERALEVRGQFDGAEAYVIRTSRKRILLLGNSDLGASHAAFRFLEELGCRWYFPGKTWEVIPSRPTITVSDLNIDQRPKILARQIWYQWDFFEKNEGRAKADFEAWARHNRMASSFGTHTRHVWQDIIAANEDEFEAHPEYRALTGGRRGGNKFCVTNPAVIEMCKAYALDYLDAHADADMVSMEPSDGGEHCECEKCVALGGVSNRVFYLVNIVARHVAEQRPGKMVGLLAYHQHCEPPTFELEPNVYVMLAGGFVTGQYSYDQLLELWPEKCRNMGFYEYYSCMQWNWDMLPGGNGANVTYLTDRIRAFAARNGSCICAESGNNWGVHGRGYYVANKLMWNPDADVDAILADFYEQAFGPAAAVMQRYYERLAPETMPKFDDGVIGAAFRDVAEATELAADRPDVLARLDKLKIYLRYVHLYKLRERAPDAAENKRLAEELFTHVYRSRYTYMNHWQAILHVQAQRAAKQHDEPSWRIPTGLEDPWIAKPDYTCVWTDKPSYTSAEIATFFAEGLAYFKP
jgi:hypothetical protein